VSESALVQQILEMASKRGHRLFVNAQGFYKTRSKTGHVYGVTYGVGGAGAPDLIGWTRSGQFIAIEVKVRGKKPKPHQDAWIAAALLSCPGLRIGWADSVERAVEIMEND
jgi:hypothetical protein